MKYFDISIDGRFIGRASDEDMEKLQRLLPFKGVSFVETLKGLGCSFKVSRIGNLEQMEGVSCILHPPWQ